MTAGCIRIGFVHIEEFDSEDRVTRILHAHEATDITSALESLGHEVIQVPNMDSLLQNTKSGILFSTHLTGYMGQQSTRKFQEYWKHTKFQPPFLMLRH
ncbi:hypothetical protein IFM47457_10613 [Aspergillus lentulus]|nr:hypothetical protein IFM47457_10613 [Aspergillus lentulus]